MASKVEIANRALQKLGARRIVSLGEDSVNGRAINTAYEPVKLAELRKHSWSFAVKRASIAADAAAPLFNRGVSYQLPSDFVKLLAQDPEQNMNDLDWQIEGRKIITNETAPLEIRYIYNVDDPNEMDALFRETLSSKLALELAEELTQSNTKKEALLRAYKDTIAEARKANAFERVSQVPQSDSWVTIRNGFTFGTGG